jgi:hypothetical protein
METSSNRLERVFGRARGGGPLRLTLAPTPATHLLIPDFADFASTPRNRDGDTVG